MNPMFDRYYMNPKALVRDKESGASARVHAKPKKKGGKVKGIGQWKGKDVPGMYQDGGGTSRSKLIPGIGDWKGQMVDPRTGMPPGTSIKKVYSNQDTVDSLRNELMNVNELINPDKYSAIKKQLDAAKKEGYVRSDTIR